MGYIIPEYNKNNFTCPHCQVVAEQKWRFTNIFRTKINEEYHFKHTDSRDNLTTDYCKKLAVSTCSACHKEHFWIQDQMVFPRISNAPLPNEDMPENVKEIYNEAREVFSVSPKAAAALLRLSLQYLCIYLGGDGGNINNDIKKLVSNGLPVKIQRALDIVRVAGNNAVHPGVLDLQDNKTSASFLFDILNIIVDNQIVQPKKIDGFYNALPEAALAGIKNRDK